MAWHSSTDTWPGVDEGATMVRPAPRAAAGAARRRTRSWQVWVIPTLAFVCGALVSAAVFTIGWRHQSQQNTAAESALAAAKARNHELSASLTAARASIARDQQTAAQTHAALVAARASGATIAAQAGTAQSEAGSVSSTATSMAAAAGRISSEIKTLTTYLTTTPTNELDPGYIDSQAAYLGRQVDLLQSAGGTTATATASFDTAIEKLTRLASALATHK